MATLAFFFAISGSAAYATHEVINSSDVVDNSLQGVDVRGTAGSSTAAAVNGSLTGADISGQPANAAVGQPFVNGSLTGFDIADGSIQNPDIALRAINGTKVANDSLSGTNINESSLGIVPNADALDGLDSAAFLRATAKAADANLLDGADSSAFLRTAVYRRSKNTKGVDPADGDTVCNGNETCRDSLACDAGDILLTGGILAVDNNTHVASSAPIGQSWFAAWDNNSTPDEIVFAINCVDQP